MMRNDSPGLLDENATLMDATELIYNHLLSRDGFGHQLGLRYHIMKLKQDQLDLGVQQVVMVGHNQTTESYD